ncbi:MAG TPA: hypothetical protein VLG44_05600, partial [Chlamydiales bacterium]|nr:hypothetical protein [Chlamydiales bacterium]
IDDLEFQRIDSHLDEMIDPSREKGLLDSDGKTESSKIASFFRGHLPTDLEVEAKSLSTDDLPALLVLDEKMRRLRDYMQVTQGKESSFPQKKTFVLNTNNKLVQKAFALQKAHPELAQDLARQVYDLALLSQKEIDPSEVSKILTQNTRILEKLASLVE